MHVGCMFKMHEAFLDCPKIAEGYHAYYIVLSYLLSFFTISCSGLNSFSQKHYL